jgi:PIN domain nuclease of toxin-antitoxin system
LTARDFLLDTHAALWWMEGSPRLPAACYQAVRRRGFAYVSLASAWEVAIKISSGRLRLQAPFGATVEASGLGLLPLTLDHVEEVAVLPFHHRDPFDRMLVAQARVEDLTLVTGDSKLAAYDVRRFWTSAS